MKINSGTGDLSHFYTCPVKRKLKGSSLAKDDLPRPIIVRRRIVEKRSVTVGSVDTLLDG